MCIHSRRRFLYVVRLRNTYDLFLPSSSVHMKDEKLVKRSQMREEDLGLKIIDDRNWILRKACHGDPTRSFWIRGSPLPFCSRCITFYPSILMGIGTSIILYHLIDIASWMALSIFAVLNAPLVIDGWTQYIGWRTSNNVLRSLTGMLAGTGIGFGITYMIMQVFI